ncbi:MAG TPA: alcohol dehydrogenase catalytic domain-containing protein [Longimicrobium sp.]|nr:alcohol dehydrogenase catalytic domain-containing protein [Longimicrobium sp.]
MEALVKQGGTVGVCQVQSPTPGQGEVIVEVALAGLCRTDVYVARGQIPSADPLVLGHEFAGVVHGVGPGVDGFREGDRVGVMPIIPCGACEWCRGGRALWCQRTQMLGVHRDGAFARRVAVPARCVYPIPDRMDWRLAAYLEPVAASMAVLDAPIHPGQRGLIFGDNRISLLTGRVLAAAGFGVVPICDVEHGGELEGDAYDFVIETFATDETMAHIVRALRPGGTLVLKSRAWKKVGFDLWAVLRKELTLKATQYRDLAEAIELAASGRLEVEDLLGDSHPLASFEAVFDSAGLGGPTKQFFAPSGVLSPRAQPAAERARAGARDVRAPAGVP